MISTYDQAPANGSFLPSAKELATGTATAALQIGAANLVSVTLGGIVAGAIISLPSPAIHEFISSSQNASVQVIDADGNIIVSDAFMDENGNPVSITVSADSSAGSTLSVYVYFGDLGEPLCCISMCPESGLNAHAFSQITPFAAFGMGCVG